MHVAFMEEYRFLSDYNSSLNYWGFAYDMGAGIDFKVSEGFKLSMFVKDVNASGGGIDRPKRKLEGTFESIGDYLRGVSVTIAL